MELEALDQLNALLLDFCPASPPQEPPDRPDRSEPDPLRGAPPGPEQHPTHRERIAENVQILDFALSDTDTAELDVLDQTNGTGRAVEHKWW
jgi:hypothetical protein